MATTVRELRERRATILDEARALVELAEGEDRDLSQEEQVSYDERLSEAGNLETRINRLEAMPEISEPPARRTAPVQIQNVGITRNRALAASAGGDRGAVRGMLATMKADMNPFGCTFQAVWKCA